MSRVVYLIVVICLVAVSTAAYRSPDEPMVSGAGEFDSTATRADDIEATKKIAKVAKGCFRCHSAPIQNLYTDIAWINAIPETT